MSISFTVILQRGKTSIMEEKLSTVLSKKNINTIIFFKESFFGENVQYGKRIRTIIKK